MTTTTAFRTCPLCEATCGLEITVTDGTVTRIRGDRDDVFSRGFLCPKGSALKHLHDDPDRIRTPLVRRDGVLQPATWEEAFAEVERRLLPIVDAARSRRRGRLSRQPDGAQHVRPALRPPVHQGAGNPQRVLGEHR